MDDRLQSLAKEHLMLHFTDMASLVADGTTIIDRGEGCHVFDVDGRRYIDGLSGLYCVNLGHSHGEEIAIAASEQMARLPFTSNWTVAHPPGIDQCARRHDPEGDVARLGLACAQEPVGARRRIAAAAVDQSKQVLPIWRRLHRDRFLG